MHELLVNRLGGLCLPMKSVVRLTDRRDMTLDVYRGHKATIQYKKMQRGGRQIFPEYFQIRVISLEGISSHLNSIIMTLTQ